MTKLNVPACAAFLFLASCYSWKETCEDRLGDACPSDMNQKWNCDECGRAWACVSLQGDDNTWTSGDTGFCQCIDDNGHRDTSDCGGELE